MKCFQRLCASALVALGASAAAQATTIFSDLHYHLVDTDTITGLVDLDLNIVNGSVPSGVQNVFVSSGSMSIYNPNTCTITTSTPMYFSLAACGEATVSRAYTEISGFANNLRFTFDNIEELDFNGTYQASSILYQDSVPYLNHSAVLTIANGWDKPTEMAPAPEPASCLSVGSGLILVAYCLRKKGMISTPVAA